MEQNFVFVANSVLLGIGLAMDAFSVSLANGLNEPQMRIGKMDAVAGVFAGFQVLMPLAGWLCVHTVIQYFQSFQKLIPWAALLLLGYIGTDMLLGGLRGQGVEGEKAAAGFAVLAVQGIATSMDALSVGFTISGYGIAMALVRSLIIGGVTFLICMGGLSIGKRFGTRLSDKASILGGVILIAIGIEIFSSGI